MGGGNWSADTYQTTRKSKAAQGVPDMSYDHTVRKTGVVKVHDKLDPKAVNQNGPYTDQNIRECRDSDDHPESVPIIVLFDETGSMGSVPRVVVKRLSELFGLLLRKGYVVDPQIMFGGVGDAYTDRVPLQVGQFESDNRLDEDLAAIYLEGNGGGQSKESYELAAYFVARHVVTDAWEKRGKKGYFFLIADEGVYTHVDPAQVRAIIGGTSDAMAEPISTEVIFEEIKERWNTYIIRPANGGYRGDKGIIGQWEKLLGAEHVIDLSEHVQSAQASDPDEAVSDVIALTIGLLEGSIELDDGLSDLDAVGSGANKGMVGKALAKVGGGGTVAVADSPTDLDVADNAGGIDRL